MHSLFTYYKLQSYPKPREPLGLSDCVDKALEVMLITDSISESPNSYIKSLSGDNDCLECILASIPCKSLSEDPT